MNASSKFNEENDSGTHQRAFAQNRSHHSWCEKAPHDTAIRANGSVSAASDLIIIIIIRSHYKIARRKCETDAKRAKLQTCEFISRIISGIITINDGIKFSNEFSCSLFASYHHRRRHGEKLSLGAIRTLIYRSVVESLFIFSFKFLNCALKE